MLVLVYVVTNGSSLTLGSLQGACFVPWNSNCRTQGLEISSLFHGGGRGGGAEGVSEVSVNGRGSCLCQYWQNTLPFFFFNDRALEF